MAKAKVRVVTTVFVESCVICGVAPDQEKGRFVFDVPASKLPKFMKQFVDLVAPDKATVTEKDTKGVNVYAIDGAKKVWLAHVMETGT